MRQSSNIPLVRATDGEVLPGNPFSSVVLSSARTGWNNIVVEEHRFASHELDGLMYTRHVVAINLGSPIGCEYKKEGRFHFMCKGNGTIYLSPSHQPFYVFRRPNLDRNGVADVLYLALDPLFVDDTAEELEIYPDRFELVEQQRSTDLALVHIALALRAGVRSGYAGEPMFGEALSSALTVHLLREYSGRPARTEHAHRGLSKETLARAVEYIHDQLSKELSVAAMARAVHMSRYHFTRLFKKSTGLSPYRYVTEARARKAKELLSSGKFSIADVADQVGFSDQSHLNRQIKAIFGVTPKTLLRAAKSEA